MKAGKFTIDEDEFEFSFSRSRGPGGQNVNKVNSKATLHWNIDSPVWDVDEDAKQRFVEKFKNKIGNLTFINSVYSLVRDRLFTEHFTENLNRELFVLPLKNNVVIDLKTNNIY